MIKFCTTNVRTYSYLLDNDKEIKKAKGTKKCVIDRILSFEEYVDAVFNDKTTTASQLRFKSECHDMSTEEVNKIAINLRDNKRLQVSDKIATYPHGTLTTNLCELELLSSENAY